MIGFFQRYVLHNFWLKVLSVLLAAFLWWRIAPDEQPAETLDAGGSPGLCWSHGQEIGAAFQNDLKRRPRAFPS